MPTPPTEEFIPVPLPEPMPIPLPEIPPLPIPLPIMPLPMPLPFGIPLAPTNPMVPVAGIPLPPPPLPMPFPPHQYPQLYLPPYAAPPFPYPPMPAPYPPSFPQPSPPYAPPYPSPYPIPPRGMGMVPGIPGIVSPDGGINIMPFSDAYSDMLEAHKQKMIRRRMKKLLEEYERPPWKSRRNTRRQSENEVIDVIHEEKFGENAFE